jgi:hypothetical protein
MHCSIGSFGQATRNDIPEQESQGMSNTRGLNPRRLPHENDYFQKWMATLFMATSFVDG